MKTCLKIYRTKLVFVKTIHKILSSCVFNILMVILGFLLGCGTMLIHIHTTAIRNDQYALLNELTVALEK
jgi:hypothetical protein